MATEKPSLLSRRSRSVASCSSRAAALIDHGSVESGATFTQDEVRALPLARNINAVALLTPGTVRGDSFGGSLLSFGGASIAENAYYINGFDVTNIRNFLSYADLPFDEAAGVVPNDDGRVLGAPGSYVAGWIKRGPTGFIGTNKTCAQHTVHQLVADFNAGLLSDPVGRHGALERLVAQRQPEHVDLVGWHAINAAEIARGGGVRPRDKLTRVNSMLAVAAQAPRPTLRDRVREALRV